MFIIIAQFRTAVQLSDKRRLDRDSITRKLYHFFDIKSSIFRGFDYPQVCL